MTVLRPQTPFPSDICYRLKTIKRLNGTNHSMKSFSFSVSFSAVVDTQEIIMDHSIIEWLG